MSALSEGQFDLDGYRFGGEGDALVAGPGGFDPGVVGWRTQDQDNPNGDSVNFGRDLRTPASWTFTMQSNLESIEEAMAAIGEAETAWIAEQVRLTPGAVIPLRYHIAGRTRRVYGRPRRFSHDLKPLAWQGVVNVIADFQRADTLHYDDQLKIDSFSSVPATVGGFTSPLIGPITTLAAGSARERPLTNIGGNVPTPFTAVIQGPITNPYLEGDGWRVKLNLTLAYDESVVIDTRPWAMAVTRQDGASLAGALSHDSTLRGARLSPTGATVRFGGADATGTASCSIAWRSAYNYL